MLTFLKLVAAVFIGCVLAIIACITLVAWVLKKLDEWERTIE